jgi:arylsulfatase A-like enzyme
LSYRSFDEIEDYRDRLEKRGQDASSFSSKWKFLNGTDDIATADSVIDWLKSSDQTRPFFVMMWTLSTHYPYYYAGELTDYKTPEETQNRFLNALRHGDEALGRLMAHLESTGQLDSTLVVVVGDHGEAFGRHNQWGHGTKVYDENLKVPCILINGQLFNGEERKVVGGLVDVAPTVLDVLGHTQMPPSWQGRSLFADGRHNRVYFCAPWSDFLFGYRDGNKKLIYNATKNTFEVYDLLADPLEANDLADSESAFIRAGRQHLAAWVQYQAKFYERAFRRESKPRSGTVTSAN